MNGHADETLFARRHRPTGHGRFAALLALSLAFGPACGSAENKNDQPDAGPTMCSIPGTMCDEDRICTNNRVCKAIEGETTGICAEDAALRSAYGLSPDTYGSFVGTVTDITGNDVSLLDETNDVQYTLHMDLGGLSVPIQVGDRLTIDYLAAPHDRKLRLVRDGKLLFVGEGGGYGAYPYECCGWMWSPEDREGVSVEIVDVGCGLVDADQLARFGMGLKVTAPGGESVVLGSGLAAFLDLPAGRYMFVAKGVCELAVVTSPMSTHFAAYFMVLLP